MVDRIVLPRWQRAHCRASGVHGIPACCSLRCGECGGRGCDRRPGGQEQCCGLHISRPCAEHVPPCFANHQAAYWSTAGWNRSRLLLLEASHQREVMPPRLLPATSSYGVRIGRVLWHPLPRMEYHVAHGRGARHPVLRAHGRTCACCSSRSSRAMRPSTAARAAHHRSSMAAGSSSRSERRLPSTRRSPPSVMWQLLLLPPFTGGGPTTSRRAKFDAADVQRGPAGSNAEGSCLSAGRCAIIARP